MRLAREVGEDQNPCYSRHIGTVIVNPDNHRILGTGYNGPPKNIPHADSEKWLKEVVWPQLTEEQKEPWACAIQPNSRLASKTYWEGEFVRNCEGQCPRKMLGFKSGESPQTCPCVHSEINAIINAAKDLTGSYLFLWAPSPCNVCAGQIINARIKRVYCLSGEDYSFSTRWQLAEAGVELIKLTEEWINESQAETALNTGDSSGN